jgi:hypothetical protein
MSLLSVTNDPLHKVRLGAAASVALLLLSCGGGSSEMPAPTVEINIAPATIAAGQSATLTWSAMGASTCAASGAWSGSQPTSGSMPVSPSAADTYTYTLSCSTGSSPQGSGSATLKVSPPQLSVVTSALPNGEPGSPYSATIQANGGVAPYTWKVKSGALPHNLALDGSTTSTLTLAGKPDTVVQGQAFTIEVRDSSEQSATQDYVVSILAPDTLTVSPGLLDFGSAVLGTSGGPLTETLTNTGTLAIAINSITIVGDDAANFQRTATNCQASLPAGTSCTISLTFTPAQTGVRAAALTITDDTAGSPHGASLTGVGLTAGANATFSTDSLVLGTQLVGTTSPVAEVTLTNYGAVALNVTSVTASDVFAATGTCVGSVPSMASCTISVVFTPNATGSATGMLSVVDDAADSPQSVSLSGTGSMSTPLLSGSCVVAATFCRVTQVMSGECPKGEPSEHPAGYGYCPVGPNPGGPLAHVDKSRPCVTGGSTRVGSGFCGTD